MHSATELILARMDSNPEEFVMGSSRWSNILNKLSEFAPKDEWKVVLTRWNEIRMDQLHRHIMQELCTPEESKQLSLLTSADMRAEALRVLKRELEHV